MIRYLNFYSGMTARSCGGFYRVLVCYRVGKRFLTQTFMVGLN